MKAVACKWYIVANIPYHYSSSHRYDNNGRNFSWNLFSSGVSSTMDGEQVVVDLRIFLKHMFIHRQKKFQLIKPELPIFPRLTFSLFANFVLEVVRSVVDRFLWCLNVFIRIHWCCGKKNVIKIQRTRQSLSIKSKKCWNGV